MLFASIPMPTLACLMLFMAWPAAAAPETQALPEIASTFKDGVGEAFVDYRVEQQRPADRIYFDVGRSDIGAEAAAILQQQARWLLRNPAIQIVVEGNTDARGSRAYNASLGARRAEAVRTRLVELGVPRQRIDTVSFGMDRPVDVGTSEQAYRQNRSARSVILEPHEQP